MVKTGDGTAMLKTVEGEQLTFSEERQAAVVVTDAKGEVAEVTIPNVMQSNGVIQVVNSVLLPN